MVSDKLTVGIISSEPVELSESVLLSDYFQTQAESISSEPRLKSYKNPLSHYHWQSFIRSYQESSNAISLVNSLLDLMANKVVR